jgi:hypothetical protein
MSEYGFPRRRRAAQERALRDSPTALRGRVNDPSHGLASREALDVARYVADMTAQLEAMALAADLDLLGYFMGMARAEADLFVRTNAQAGVGPDAPDDHGLADSESPSDTPVD